MKKLFGAHRREQFRAFRQEAELFRPQDVRRAYRFGRSPEIHTRPLNNLDGKLMIS